MIVETAHKEPNEKIIITHVIGTKYLMHEPCVR